MPIPDMDAYSQNFQYSAKSFFGCQYSNFVNLCLKLGVETVEAIILIIFGGRHCKTAMGLYYCMYTYCRIRVILIVLIQNMIH